MNISHVSCSEILIISLSVTGSIGLVTYYSDTNAVGRQAYEEQKQVLIDRAEAFVDAKDTLLLSIADHLNSPGFKEQSIKILSSKKRFRPNRSNVISTSDGDLVTSRLFQTDLEAESMSILTAGAIIALSTETNKIGRYQPVQNTTTDQSSTLLPPENTYAVAYTSLSRITVIHNPIQADQYPSLKSEGINNALNNIPGPYLYLNHERKPVVGSYQYIPEANMGLLVDRDQASLFKEARQKLQKILITGSVISASIFFILKRLKCQHSSKKI